MNLKAVKIQAEGDALYRAGHLVKACGKYSAAADELERVGAHASAEALRERTRLFTNTQGSPL